MTAVVVRGHVLRYGSTELRCAIGRGGIRRDKHEGDGATPAGVFVLREVFYRADRISKPETGLRVRALSPRDGWCDAPGDAFYNRLVALPYPASHERLWREDGLYDLLTMIGHNDQPPVADAGSAIFLHVASPNWSATDGCVAVSLDGLSRLLAYCTEATTIDIGDTIGPNM